MTPAMQQYYDMKKEVGDAILFFRMWDFYEMFDEDANIAHKVLWINVTSRNKNAEEPTPLAGIPYHAKDKYLPRLIRAGYKVAIAEQVSDPKLKWIVKREVVRVITPATLSLEEENYASCDITNYIISICEKDWKYGISFLELDASRWKTWELKDLNSLAWEVYKISPKEVILEKKLFNRSDIKDIFSKKFSLNVYYFEDNWNPKEKLKKHFWVRNLEGFWMENKLLAQKASSMLLSYLEQNQKSKLDHLNSICFDSFVDYMDLDESTIRSLDLIYNIGSKSSTIWTLFWVLDKTQTSMGRRLLRENIMKPLQNKEDIEKRLDLIEEFLGNPILLDKVRKKLKMISDLDNILTRLALNRALPRDLINLKKSLQAVLEIFKMIKDGGSEKMKILLNI